MSVDAFLFLGFGHIQCISRMAAFAAPAQRSLLHHIVKVSCCCRSGGSGGRDVVFCAQTAFEAFNPFAKHASDDLVLAFVELAAESVVEFPFADIKRDTGKGRLLRPICVAFRPDLTLLSAWWRPSRVETDL